MERRPNQTRRSSSSTTTPTSRPISRFYSSCFRASDQWSNENYDPVSGGSARAIDEAYQPNEGLFDRERATHFLFDGNCDPNLTALLQHQQAMLQKLLAQQDMISEKQKAMDQRILSIESKLSTSTSIDSSPGSSGSCDKRTRVTRDLTVSEIKPIRVYGDYI